MTDDELTDDMLPPEREAKGRLGPVLSRERVCRFIKKSTKSGRGHRLSDGVNIRPGKFITPKELKETGLSMTRIDHLTSEEIQKRGQRTCQSKDQETVDAYGVCVVASLRSLKQKGTGERLLLVLDAPVEEHDDHAHAEVKLMASQVNPDRDDFLEVRDEILKLMIEEKDPTKL